MSNFKEKAEQKAKELKTKATDATKNIDTSKLKEQAEGATGEFNKLDNKKKGMIAGGAGALLLGLVFAFSGGNSSLKTIESAFPASASVKEQCTFFSNYEGAVMRATMDLSVSTDDIIAALKTTQEPSISKDTSIAHKGFIEEKAKYERKITRLREGLKEEKNQKRLAEMDVEKEIGEEITKKYNRCMNVVNKG